MIFRFQFNLHSLYIYRRFFIIKLKELERLLRITLKVKSNNSQWKEDQIWQFFMGSWWASAPIPILVTWSKLIRTIITNIHTVKEWRERPLGIYWGPERPRQSPDDHTGCLNYCYNWSLGRWTLYERLHKIFLNNTTFVLKSRE